MPDFTRISHRLHPRGLNLALRRIILVHRGLLCLRHRRGVRWRRCRGLVQERKVFGQRLNVGA